MSAVSGLLKDLGRPAHWHTATLRESPGATSSSMQTAVGAQIEIAPPDDTSVYVVSLQAGKMSSGESMVSVCDAEQESAGEIATPRSATTILSSVALPIAELATLEIWPAKRLGSL